MCSSIVEKSTIIPIPKNSKPKEMNDLWPVAMTSIHMKCLEKLIITRLLPDVTELLDERHFAYHPHKSTEDAVLTMLNGIYEHLEHAGTYVKIMFVDFTNAFNTIQPHLLVTKLINLNVDPTIISWIYNFLLNRCQQVKLTPPSHPFSTLTQGPLRGVSCHPCCTPCIQMIANL